MCCGSSVGCSDRKSAQLGFDHNIRWVEKDMTAGLETLQRFPNERGMPRLSPTRHWFQGSGAGYEQRYSSAARQALSKLHPTSSNSVPLMTAKGWPDWQDVVQTRGFQLDWLSRRQRRLAAPQPRHTPRNNLDPDPISPATSLANQPPFASKQGHHQGDPGAGTPPGRFFCS